VTIKRALFFALAGLLWCAAAAAEPAGTFPRPPELEPDILFWTKIYTEVDTHGGLIHDSSHLGVVYEVLRFPDGASRRTQRRMVKAAKLRTKKILQRLARGKRENLSEDEARVLALWPDGVSNKSLSAATRRLRFQLGQADKFKAGLARSGIWEAHIREILADMGLPQELVALPHVESSFNPKARSRVGAAGLWQFTRSTGRRFMRIDRSVDERMDPYLSTVAAARLLSHNYQATGAWPLAITSYNHGTAGVRRAARKLGTKDITRIVREYSSRRFGFASRNFYVAFLAAVEIHFNPDKYFDAIPRHSPPPTQLVRVPDYVKVSTLERVLGIDMNTLREHNPALRPSIWRGAKHVPRGYELRIPASKPRDEMLAALAQIDQDERYPSQQRDRFYTVQRGNTLAGIAKHFDVDVDDLVAANDLKSRHRIRAGQVLSLPLPDGVKVAAAGPVPSTARAQAAPEPTLVAQDGQYTVRRGDSVWLISRRLGVGEETLVALNDLGDGDRIHVGQVLRVEPEKAPAAADAVANAAVASISDEAALSAEHVAVIEAPAVDAAADAAILAMNTGEAVPVEHVPAEAEAPAAVGAAAALPEEPALQTAASAVAADTTPVEAAQPEEAAQEAAEVLQASTPELLDDGLIARVEQAEPASAEEAEELAPALPLTVQAELSADPSDYSVFANDSIEVQAAETLGHYADWLGLRTWQLRTLNGMRYGQPVVIGQRLSLDFSKVKAVDFEQRRVAYHRSLQESFFKRFRIAGTTTHVIRQGESLWILARRNYEIPIWLLRQYNPDLNFDSVAVGANVTVPQVEPMDDSSPAGNTTTAKLG
jgi:membrane-bound lytic murein transglycosylase D